MKRKITWVRHGESVWNAVGKWQGQTDVELSDKGREQARLLGKRLDLSQFDAIYSSDLKRAHETGQLALPGAKFELDSRLREINFGKYEGKCRAELSGEEKKSVYAWWANPYTHKLEGGESMACLNERVAQWQSELPEECDVLVFAHGGVIRNAIWQVVGPPAAGDWSISIDNTSLTVVEFNERGTLLQKVNDFAHLELLK